MKIAKKYRRITLAHTIVAIGICIVQWPLVHAETVVSNNCGDPAKPINQVREAYRQGLRSVTIEGVVVGADRGRIAIQEEDSDVDGDLSTSEALFVSMMGPHDIGDVLRVTGRLHSFDTLYLLADERSKNCGYKGVASPVSLRFPLKTALRNYEAMAVQISQMVYVSGHVPFPAPKFGDLIVSFNRRNSYYNGFSRVFGMGRDWLIFDFGSVATRSDGSMPRAGSVTSDLSGIITTEIAHFHDRYRFKPYVETVFEDLNPRPVDASIKGRLKIAYMAAEDYPLFERSDSKLKRIKLIEAIKILEADILYLELRTGLSSMLEDLNRMLGDDIYSMLKSTGDVKVIYRKNVVLPKGPSVISSQPGLRKGVLFQAFSEISTGEDFSVVGVKFSEDSSDIYENLLTWIDSIPSIASGDVLIMGYFPAAYGAKSLQTFEIKNYIDIMADNIKDDELIYSSVDAFASLVRDYAFANPAMREQIVDARYWRVNADESPTVGANGLYAAPDIYRHADRDPIVIGVTLSSNN